MKYPSSQGLAAWDATPGLGKVQMLILAGLIEFHDEIFASKRGDNKHYLRGGIPGKNHVPGLYDPFGLSSRRSEEEVRVYTCDEQRRRSAANFRSRH